MYIFIRVDASVEIGTGHVMRCLTYAHQQKNRGNKIAFICRRKNGDCIELIEENGFKVFALPEVKQPLCEYTEKFWETDAEQTIQILKKYVVKQVVIDHYSIEEKWEKKIRPYTKEIMVIDDLANRKHDCDLLLDQNFYLDMNSRYEGLVPKHTKLLLGPKYALLREEFKLARKKVKPFNGKVERLFIFFGGSDPTNETEKVLQAIKPLIEKFELMVDVVVGKSNPNKEKIKELCKSIKGTSYYCQINNISELMLKADLAIGAGGATTWERMYLLLPSIVISVAENQIEIANALHKKGLITYLGHYDKVDRHVLHNQLQYLLLKTDLLLTQRNKIETFM